MKSTQKTLAELLANNPSVNADVVREAESRLSQLKNLGAVDSPSYAIAPPLGSSAPLRQSPLRCENVDAMTEEAT